VVQTDDLSITFHIVSYLRGEVDHLGQIAATTLAMSEGTYPFGWKQVNGEPRPHHLYDAVRLVRLGWSSLSLSQRRLAEEKFSAALKWRLSTLFDGQGRIAPRPDPHETLEDAAYFTVSLLDELGYFDPKKRFWTERKLPDGEPLREQLIAYLRAMPGPGSLRNSALGKLQR
jgi:hypothetical protein